MVTVKGVALTQLANGSYSGYISGIEQNKNTEVSINGSPQGTIRTFYEKNDYMLEIGDTSGMRPGDILDFTSGELHEDRIEANDGWRFVSGIEGLKSKSITDNQDTSIVFSSLSGRYVITYGQDSEYLDFCTIYSGDNSKLLELKLQGYNQTANIDIPEDGRLIFTYHKDGSVSRGADAFWLKKIDGSSFILPDLPADFVPATPVVVSGAVLADMRAINNRMSRIETALGFND